MGFMDRKRELLQKQSDGGDATRVINGRLYMQSADGNSIFRPVPRGMDDARDLKENPPSEYYVRKNSAYELFTPEKVERELKKGTGTCAARTGDSDPFDFLRVDTKAAIIGEDRDGSTRVTTLEPGSYVSVGLDGKCFAVSREDFAEKYEVLPSETKHMDREIPEVGDPASMDGFEASL